MTVADAEIKAAAADMLAASLERAASAARDLNAELRQLIDNANAAQAAMKAIRSKK